MTLSESAGEGDKALLEDLVRRLNEANDLANHFRFAEALVRYRAFLSEYPHSVPAAFGAARCLFGLEDWEAAWKAYEVRFRMFNKPGATRTIEGKKETFPVWESGPPPKRLLILPEQGIGDTVQFMRFAPVLAEQGVMVQMVVYPKVAALVRSSLSGVRVLASDGEGQAHGVDAHCSLLDIPARLDLRPEKFAPQMPYLFVEPDRVFRWQRALTAPGKLNVGIAWQGNKSMVADKRRSALLAAFAPLARNRYVRLISLQKGEACDQVADVPFGDRIVVPPPEFDAGPDAFLDTAALMASLDLVVSVDTSICHVAGALARPVWIALAWNGPDWRWLGRIHDTPWYPTARLYRQSSNGDWNGVFERMADDLDRLAG